MKSGRINAGMARAAFGTLSLVLLAAWTGCSSPPRRPVISYQPVRDQHGLTAADTGAIESEFQDLCRSAEEAAQAGRTRHHLCLLNVGDDALLARVHLIRAARHTLDVQTFIWANDESGRFLFRELLRAAQRGVRVRVLVDQFAISQDPGEIARMGYAHPNLTLRFFKPLAGRASNRKWDYLYSLPLRWSRLNERMHNKLLLVDGCIGIVGGRNVQNKYFDRDPDFIFKDRDAVVVGPCVRDMHRSFDAFWHHREAVDVRRFQDVLPKLSSVEGPLPPEEPGGKGAGHFDDIEVLANAYSITDLRESLTLHEVGEVEFLTDPPDKVRRFGDDREDMHETLRRLFREPRDTVVIQSPYLVLSRDTYRLFSSLRHGKRDLRFIFSSNGMASADHPPVYAVSWKQRKRIVKNLKCQIYELKPGPADAALMVAGYDQLARFKAGGSAPAPDNNEPEFPVATPGPRISLHAKSLVMDGRIALVGSHNFDPRSIRFNTECGILVRDEMFARALQADIFRDIHPRNSWVVARLPDVPVISYFSGIIGSISAALPIFDIWPFRYTSCYELVDGQEAVPPGHPDFYSHYRDVGQFPGVDSTVEVIQARLIKIMAGWAAPLL